MSVLAVRYLYQFYSNEEIMVLYPSEYALIILQLTQILLVTCFVALLFPGLWLH